METDLGDIAYNIGWKLRFHLEQRCSQSILSTYEQERRPIAQQLINFDREYLELFANPNLDSDGFHAAYLEAMKFTTGIGIQYAPSLIVQSASLAGEKITGVTGLSPGMRLPDFQMVNQADGVPVTIHHRLAMNGQFRTLVFAGDISQEYNFQRLVKFGRWFTTFQQRYVGAEVIVIHSAKRADVELMDLPDVFHPWNEQDGYNYWGVYADDESYHDGCGNVYQRCGIVRDDGCVVVVRPDGYMSLVCGLDQVERIEDFFNNLGRTVVRNRL